MQAFRPPRTTDDRAKRRRGARLVATGLALYAATLLISFGALLVHIWNEGGTAWLP